jgi:predicted nuclease with TOPRIM domain
MPSDEQVTEVIDRLEEERERLRAREGAEDPTLDADRERLEEIRVDLDRLWDYLRQRRALRDAGQDPDGAHERSAATVEKYWQ